MAAGVPIMHVMPFSNLVIDKKPQICYIIDINGKVVVLMIDEKKELVFTVIVPTIRFK